MKAQSMEKAEQALNKIAAAQLMLETIEDADFSEAIDHLCQAYDLISAITDPKTEQEPLLDALGPELLKALMEQMIDKSKEE
ncbi:MAG: hypothetical protein J6A26_03910 [Oscillospiraceae bacterium]|nr:hypothetical protein [Oscillospiraceae bacterium]